MDGEGLVKKSLESLKSYCEKEDFKGWDPYDGLNSWVTQRTFLGRIPLFRLAWIQLFKRNPVNLRKVFGVPKGYNAKGVALFVIGYCNFMDIEPNVDVHKKKVEQLADMLIQMQSKGYSGACWGYNFDWQARAFYQPKWTPTVVATSFVVEALFMAYERLGKEIYKKTALTSAEFVLKDLNKTYNDSGDYTLSYSPLDKTQVFNAGLLGAKLLSQCAYYGDKRELFDEAKKICQYVCKYQNLDGSWAYSLLIFHQWIDSFHTGFNLECLYAYQNLSGDDTFKDSFEKGMHYYLNNFFHSDGRAKYYNDKTYPIDIHAPAQLVVTLAKLDMLNDHKALADSVLGWTINNMQHENGFFYYQKKQGVSSKIPYMRWAQSWMFYAMSYYISKDGDA
ncbi:delta-aminolevulinic acid dehydratase [Allomuricauda sp. d1]|uniref:delta-aminolevulinic acid dehydratase n=1 Tax=Allomuricauda sp. d1 TaxID=3136725 RepID=UPI0031D21DD0